MATKIPLKFYDAQKDEYRLPGGQVVEGFRVRAAEEAARDWRDAASAYDPYNHIGRYL